MDRAFEAREGAWEDAVEAIGAGDQGIMFGYATNEISPELMPLPIVLAHRLARRLAEVRKSGVLPWLGPHGKTQVTVEYDGDGRDVGYGGKPVRVDTVMVSAQHSPAVSRAELEEGIREEVVRRVIGEPYLERQTRILINLTGRFVMGGPRADTGLTGLKVIVNTYGGMARHGGGALSGKDPTKVDHSGAYAARYVAKNVVAAGLAERCEVQVA